MKIRTSQKKHRIAKYMTDLKFDKIKKRNLDFSLVYSENGNSENYTEVLNWSEIEKPKFKNIEIQKIIIWKNNIQKKTLSKKHSEKLILILDFHNKKKPYN